MVQTPRELHLKWGKWRDAVYSGDTVPKVYLPDCLSLPWDLIDSLYLLTVPTPSRAVGDLGFRKTLHMTEHFALGRGVLCRQTYLDGRGKKCNHDANISVQNIR